MNSSGLIELPRLCGAEDAFWDYQLTLNTSHPQLTTCFQRSAVIWFPQFYLLLASLIYVPSLYNLPVRWTIKTGLNKTKIGISAVLSILSLLDLVFAIVDITSGEETPNYIWITPSISVIVYALSAFVIHLEYKKAIHSSGVLLFYWLFQIVLGIIPFSNHVSQEEIANMYSFVTFFIGYALIVLQFLICFVRDFYDNSCETSEEKMPLLDKSIQEDDQDEDKKAPCPEIRASFLTRNLFTWIFPMIIEGNRRPLTFEDMPDILEQDKCQRIYPEFKAGWDKRIGQLAGVDIEKEGLGHISALPILKTLIQAAWKPFIISGIMRLIFGLMDFMNPVLLQLVIDVVASDDPNYMWKGLVLGVVLLAFQLVQFVFAHNYFHYCTVMSMNGRTAVITAVYRKALKLSSQSRRTTTVGEIVNLMSVDAQKIYDNFFDIHEIWACTLDATIAMVYLWTIVGPSALSAIALVAIMAPISGFYMTRKYAKLQDEQMVHKDKRLKTINEILSGIKVLKMYAWEPSFRAAVDETRSKELFALRHQAYLHGGIGIFWNCMPFLLSLVVFTTYVLASPDNYLSPQVAFVSLSVIGILNWATAFLPMFLGFAAQAYVSLKRITRMLLQDEIDRDAIQHDDYMDEAVQIYDGTFTWDKNVTDRTTLQDINMTVHEGELVAVVGTVGVGKSSLIQALLGEMHKISGTVKLKGTVAYVPQQAWIQNNTLKNNVIFGKPVNDMKYQEIIHCCALMPDLKILPAGDSTEIGEKGVNLSGGQKQRVSLARAVYQDESTYLLDDPLSAVDAHVGKHIFDKLIGPEGMLKHKTRILVTHGLTYLPNVDRIFVIKDGRISETGKFQELMTHNGAFAEFVRTYLQEAQDNKELSDNEDLELETRVLIQRQLSVLSQTDSELSHSLHESFPSRSGDHGAHPHIRRRVSRIISRTTSVKSDKEDTLRKQQLIEEETAEVGSIKWPVLKDFMLAGGWWRVILLVFFLAFYCASLVVTNLWLSAWSDDPYDPGPEGQAQTKFRLAIYGTFGAMQLVGVSATALTLYLGCVVASGVLHSRMIRRILRAPMEFFDITPIGRIVNRFSTDMDKVDVNIPMNSRWWLFNLAFVITTITIILYTTPIFIVVIIPLLIIYYIIQKIYIAAVRQMKRIDSIRRSPIFINFDETLVGATSIRAYRQQKRFIAKNDRLTDDSQIAYYPINIAQRFLGILLNAIGSLIVFFATIFSVLGRDTVSPGLAGVAITWSMQATWSLSMMIRGATELETHIVSVERIKEYSEVKQEAPWRIEGNKPRAEWPDKGVVKFDNYSTRYRAGLDLVLKGLTFTVQQGEKLGIVGRTGAGKSSMALSLFRIIESAGGRIMIDGQDISLIGLHDLREKLTVIPQDPVLFSGTLRNNLDPFSRYNEEELWHALEMAHLKEFVSGLSEGLTYECGEGGEALSVGQRQLVCLARALLRRSQVLILDEATAAVDLETDELIQTTIRTVFKDCTVLTIAHRLNTIMDYNRVLVLSDGQMKEFDQPSKLLQDTSSVFYNMAKDANLV